VCSLSTSYRLPWFECTRTNKPPGRTQEIQNNGISGARGHTMPNRSRWRRTCVGLRGFPLAVVMPAGAREVAISRNVRLKSLWRHGGHSVLTRVLGQTPPAVTQTGCVDLQPVVDKQGNSRQSPKPPRRVRSPEGLCWWLVHLRSKSMSIVLHAFKQAWGFFASLERLKQTLPLKGKISVSLGWDFRDER
jgi:hypothetical protein